MPALAGAIAAACLLPVVYVLWSTASLGPAEAYDFLVRPRIGAGAHRRRGITGLPDAAPAPHRAAPVQVRGVAAKTGKVSTAL